MPHSILRKFLDLRLSSSHSSRGSVRKRKEVRDDSISSTEDSHFSGSIAASIPVPKAPLSASPIPSGRPRHTAGAKKLNELIPKPVYVTSLTCTTRVPTSAITYEMVDKVIHSWDHGIKQSADWDRKAGEMFTRKIFELAPQTVTMFGFPSGTKHDDPALSENRAFMDKAIRLIKAIDMAVSFLAPDLSPLKVQLQELGVRHAIMGCRPSHWPVVGAALLHVLEEFVGDRFTDDVRESWTVIYNFLAYHMIQGLLKKDPSLAEDVNGIPVVVKEEGSTNKLPIDPEEAPVLHPSINWDCNTKVPLSDISFETVCTVVDSWEHGIKIIPNWDSKLGPLWVRYIFRYGDADCKRLIGYNEKTAWDDPTLSDDSWFVRKGERLIRAIDLALTFLGPDLSHLEGHLKELGRRHHHMGCKPHHWPIVGEALFDLFREHMGDNGCIFTSEVEAAWRLIYRFLGYHMIQGMAVEKEGC